MTNNNSKRNDGSMLLADLLIFCLSAGASVYLKTIINPNNRITHNTTTTSTHPTLPQSQPEAAQAAQGAMDNPLRFADTTNETSLQKALEQGTTLNATENVFTVNEDNVPTLNGHARSEMRLNQLWHRATYIIIRHEPTNDNDHSSSTQNNNNEKELDEDNTFLLVQRRSNIKDYCPGKLDATPGGVLGFGEDYKVNAEREIMEEMNINVSTSSTCTCSKSENGNYMNYLFTFPYQDDKVKCWGGLFEVVYTGALSDITMQETEVSEVLRLSLSEIRSMASEHPNDWMPDSLYAVQLYLQRKSDLSISRRTFPEYSTGNLQKYALRPKPKAIFFDCDDCLYFDGWIVANQLTAKIEEWCTLKKNLPAGEAYQLYKTHGTALKGLLAAGHMPSSDDAIDEYLRDVHDLPISTMISKDEELRNMILSIDPSIPKYIFTASVKHHAERCLKALGIDDLFVDIIDVKSCNLATKHSQESFEAAMRIANVNDPESCIFLDDSVKNIEAARKIGWRGILVGLVGRDCGTAISSEHAEQEIERIHDMPKVLPELFLPRKEE